MHSLLATHSAFSIGQSILSVEKLVDQAVAVGATSVALTDTMSVTGMIDFTNRATKAGLKPIIGCRLRLVDDGTWRKPKGEKVKAPPEFFLNYYVLSETGLKALFKLLSLANSEARFYTTAKLAFTDLYDVLATVTSDDVAIATGDVYSVTAHPDARSIIEKLVASLGQHNVFATLTPINAPYWDSMNSRAIAISDALNIPTLVSRPIYYAKGEADAAEVMNAISRNVKIAEPWHNSPYSRDLHPMNAAEMKVEIEGAVTRLAERDTLAELHFITGFIKASLFADMVHYTWSKAPVSLPVMAPDEFAAVVASCKAGWATRFATSTFGHKPTAEELQEIYKPRLTYELGVLRTLNFSGYFLLVEDVVNFAKRSGILVGPGRGSVGGSLVAYLMGITDCDPIRFGLLFERFINPDRIDLPDADLDFMSARRHEIVAYLIEKYGAARVAGVSNFGTLATASSIRDVSRVVGLAEGEYRCSKMVPKKHGQSIKLVESAELVPEIAEFRDKNPVIWNIAVTLEGTIRNMSQHAAGIVVGGVDIIERAVVESRKGESVVCWDKRIVEDQGLVKMDILGLSTLDLINLTLDYIRERHGKRIDLLRIPLDDPKVLDNFANARSTGVFQFESGGMRRLLKELGRDGITFDDVTAATALYRPGPMESGMMDSFYKRKQGDEDVSYDHPLMEPILAPTYGVMVYQEQIMQVARTIAGYSGPAADKLRKIMGKKLPEEMKKERGKFVDGCVATVSADPEWAAELFDKIEGFAGYGFNKSHSVEYTLISYQGMWLKTYYPVEFLAAALSLMPDDNLPPLLKEASRLGIEVALPDVNLSSDRFEILTDTRICIPFSRVKGLSGLTAKAILDARTTPFLSKEDMVARVNKRIVNKAKVDALDRIGAFARIEAGQLASDHPDRIRDQRELIPGLITTTVPIGRDMQVDKATVAQIVALVGEYRTTHGPADGRDGMPVKPKLGSTSAKFMVISDAPTNQEEQSGSMADGKSFDYVAEALRENEMTRKEGYWTALIKRPKEGKQVSPEEIKTYLPYLTREIELLKPPIIILLGSITVRHFFPDFKGKASEAAGTIVYSKELDANVIIAFNPAEIYHDPDKQLKLNEVFAVAQSLSN